MPAPMPMPARPERPSAPFAVAHRTPRTAAACERLAQLGAAVFEVDVQVAAAQSIGAAGGIVVSHFFRVPGTFGRLERDNVRLRLRRTPDLDPRLAAIAGLVPPDRRIMLDLKERDPARRAELLKRMIATLPNRARFVVCSPHAEDLARVREAGFATWRTADDRDGLRALLADAPLPDAGASIRHTLLKGGALEDARAAASTLVAWTVNDPRRAAQLLSLGVDGITTDRAAVIAAVARLAA
jgi:glycerophosphoryl diester phosphodiesterase